MKARGWLSRLEACWAHMQTWVRISNPQIKARIDKPGAGGKSKDRCIPATQWASSLANPLLQDSIRDAVSKIKTEIYRKGHET